MQKPLNTTVLIILDGWGHRADKRYNAIANANTPNWNYLWQNYPHTLIDGSGQAVGLPEGQMGNSEVGHLTMGAGRIVYQELTRIDKAIEDKSFFQNPVLKEALQRAVSTHKSVHIMGLVSPGGVHSHEKHIHAMIEMTRQYNVPATYLHAFLDGRDVPPQSATTSLNELATISSCRIASIVGRYYAMDRDQRWERVQAAYDMLTLGKADFHASTPLEGLTMAYARGETDEFVKPTLIHAENQPPVIIEEGDIVIFMNFRADRARQLSRAFTDNLFHSFPRTRIPQLGDFITLTQYADDIAAKIVFAPESLQHLLGECIANQGWKQLRLAETEKYAHVTFFFNGGVEKPFPGEERILIPSPKVATYDHQPEMSAPALTKALTEAIYSNEFAFIICNYANPDMVGHTGNYEATLKAIETIDEALGQILVAVKATNAEIIITADHGNAECMFDEHTKQAHTAHTSDLVPFIYIGKAAEIIHEEGCLADIAPTLLYLMNLSQPVEMSGKKLLRLL